MDRDFKGVWITKEMWLNEDLGWTEKLLLIEIESLEKNGECFASNKYFAKFFRMSTRRIQQILETLKEKGLISISLFYREGTKEVEKRIIHRINSDTIPHEENFVTPRNLFHHPHEESFVTPHEENFVTPHEENFVDNNTLVINTKDLNNTTNKTTNKGSKKNMIENEFESLWKSYPRKQGKGKALESYIKARKKSSVSYERVQKGIDNYKRYIEVHQVGEEFIKHGSTWFKNECWEEEYNLKRDSIKGQRHGFLGLYLNEMEKQADIIDYEGSGSTYDERGSFESIGDYSNFVPQSLSKFR